MASTRSPLNIAPDDEPGGAPLTSWYTQGVTDGFGDRLLMFDNAATGPIELLRIRPEFAAVPGFESALRSRFSQLTTFNHPGFAQARVVNHLDNGGGLTVASTHVTGTRLAALFEASRPSPGMHPGAVREVFGDLVSAIGDLHNLGAGVAHGALSADRVILTFDRRLVVTDYVFGTAIDRLRLPADRLWNEFGLVGDASTGRVQLDQRGDLTQLGLLMLCLVLGRRVTPDEYPQRIPSLLRDFTNASDRRAPDLTGTMRGWLEQAIEPSGFTSVSDAARSLAEWPARPHYIDLHAAPKPRALAPAAPAEAPADAPAEVTPASTQGDTAPAPAASDAGIVDTPIEAVAPAALEPVVMSLDSAASVEEVAPVAAAELVAVTQVETVEADTADTETAGVELEPLADAVGASTPLIEAEATNLEPAAISTDAVADTPVEAADATLVANDALAQTIDAPLAAATAVEATESAPALVDTPAQIADATIAIADTPAVAVDAAIAPADASITTVASEASVADAEPAVAELTAEAVDAVSVSEDVPAATNGADVAAEATRPVETVTEPVLETPSIIEAYDASPVDELGDDDDLAAVQAAASAAFSFVESLHGTIEESPDAGPESVDVPAAPEPDLFDIDSRLSYLADADSTRKPAEDAAHTPAERIESVVRVSIPETPPVADRPSLLLRPDRILDLQPTAPEDTGASTLAKPAASHPSFILPEPPAAASAPAAETVPSLRFIKLGPSAPTSAPVAAPPPTLSAPVTTPPPAPPERVPFAWASEAAEPDVEDDDEEPVAATASSPILKWTIAALVTLAVGQGGVIYELLSRQPIAGVTRIHVDSPTPGDTVLLDGKAIGVTPLDVPLTSPDSVVQVVPRGKETAALETGRPPVIPAVAPSAVGASNGTRTDARPLPSSDAARGATGGVRVVSPIALQVMAGKEFLGSSDQGPVFTAPGARDLDFVNNTVGFRTTQRVQVEAGQVVAVRIDPPNGTLTVTAQPSAQVWIDGRRVGDTPISNLPISLGEHEIVFKNPKLGERRQKTIVQNNGVTRVTASFNP